MELLSVEVIGKEEGNFIYTNWYERLYLKLYIEGGNYYAEQTISGINLWCSQRNHGG